MILLRPVTQVYQTKNNPSSQNRSPTYDLPFTGILMLMSGICDMEQKHEQWCFFYQSVAITYQG